MSLIEYVGPTGSGKTSEVISILKKNKNIKSGRKFLKDKHNRLNFIFLIIENFPTLIKGSLKDLILAKCFIFDCSLPFKKKITIAIFFFILLVKTRLLVASKDLFIIDQGLHQFLLTSVSNKFINFKNFMKWRKNFIHNKEYLAQELKFKKNNFKKIKKNIRSSKKHIEHKMMSDDFIKKQIYYLEKII